ncbi:DUF983 domain-containing protein [Algoriphagus aquimarinus]|uniref:Uncharacterized conserved protein, DUF983 family n=1 Tax=Algoriphagus aquimarinus TaxID=237018 RepID=A0A1I0YFG2_9BACT|nr:DUF983 domain-containing protein [Algoriphagus aquimarinus]SFB12155.1 Uncharacterized conserved protein, DUF983 family [Algoriphagus aquimarinus]|tara:strand:+ start:33661 stop:34035 length:375 start_codon:yes stop_codon:yes gene_type:complete
MSNKSTVKAILGAKCPQCHEGDLFSVPVNSYRKLSDVNKSCSECGANFHAEPDFFYGAMYVSYGFSVALVITTMVALNVLMEKPELWMYLTTVALSNILLMPLMLRYSKVLYLYNVGKLKYRGY